MEHITLGKTGLEVSVAGLGAGGPSRLGTRTDASDESPVDLVRQALDLGITFVDTAPSYGTEEIVGKAIAGRRDEIVLSTKVRPRERAGQLNTASEVRRSFEQSLRNLQTDVIDVLHLHAVRDNDYAFVLAELLPVLEELRREGSVRFLAISEEFGSDPSHVMLQRALGDTCWDVMMVGFNLLNPSARLSIFPTTSENGMGIEIMYAVRRALSQPDRLRQLINELLESGSLNAGLLDLEDPLGFLVEEGGARSVVDAAYRFARHEVGADLILTGTGSPAHLVENIASINAGPLPIESIERLRLLFGHIDTISGD